jgi:hypothetical protein
MKGMLKTPINTLAPQHLMGCSSHVLKIQDAEQFLEASQLLLITTNDAIDFERVPFQGRVESTEDDFASGSQTDQCFKSTLSSLTHVWHSLS